MFRFEDYLNDYRNSFNYPPKTVITTLAIIACAGIALTIIGNTILRNYAFNGEVENVDYDWNRFPIISIKGETYDLNYDGWETNSNKIRIGDRMIKKKGEMTLKLIKQHSRDTIDLLYKKAVRWLP
jgi:hypothetical protein